VSTSSERSSSDSRFFRLAASGEAGLLLLAWALGQWLDIPWLEQLHPSVSAVIWGVVATVPLLLGLAWILTTATGPLRRLVDLVVEQLGPYLAGRPVSELALLAALAGIAEEVLFRGVVQVGFARIMPEAWALFAASAIFGLVHFASRTYAALAGVIGLYLGALFLFQESLLAPIITHALYDFVALLLVVQRVEWTQSPPS
jgi:membrane protease YdiL (CAAX protease family)